MATSAFRLLAPLLLAVLLVLSLGPAAVLGQFVPVSSSTLYSVSVGAVPPAVSFTPASPSLSLSFDSVDVGVPLGFTFSFYDVPYSFINVGANGDVQFQTAVADFFPGTFGYGNFDVAPFIAIFYSDLYPLAPGSRQYATIGTAPNRQFILRYTAVPFCCDTVDPVLTADLVLTETANRIELRYYNVNASSAYSVYDFKEVDIGIEGYTVQGVDDYVSVVDDVEFDASFAGNLTGFVYSFTPTQAFTSTVGPAAPQPSNGTFHCLRRHSRCCPCPRGVSPRPARCRTPTTMCHP